MKIKCLVGRHLKSGLTILKTDDTMSATYANGLETKIKLPDIKIEVCVFCHTLFYKETK